MIDRYVYDDLYTPSYSCECCEKLENENEHLKQAVGELLNKLIDQLYGHGQLDIARLDDTIGQMCDELDVKLLADTLPMIARHEPNSIFEFAAAMNQ